MLVWSYYIIVIQRTLALGETEIHITPGLYVSIVLANLVSLHYVRRIPWKGEHFVDLELDKQLLVYNTHPALTW